MRDDLMIAVGVVRAPKGNKGRYEHLGPEFIRRMHLKLSELWRARMVGSYEHLEVTFFEQELEEGSEDEQNLPGKNLGYFCVGLRRLDKGLVAPAAALAKTICAELAPKFLCRVKWYDRSLKEWEEIELLRDAA